MTILICDIEQPAYLIVVVDCGVSFVVYSTCEVSMGVVGIVGWGASEVDGFCYVAILVVGGVGAVSCCIHCLVQVPLLIIMEEGGVAQFVGDVPSTEM